VGIDIGDRCLESEQLCVPRFNAPTLDLRNSNSWNQRTKVWIQTRGLVFQSDSEVEQAIDPNRNQMEQSKGLEVIKSKDMKVGLRKDQPWKRDPMDPVNLSGSHKDLDQTQIGTEDKGQRGSSKLSNIKGNLGKRRSRIGINIGSKIDSSIRRREIKCNCVLPCDQSIRINWSGSKLRCLESRDDRNRIDLGIDDDRSVEGRPNQSVGGLSDLQSEIRRKWCSGEGSSSVQYNWKCIRMEYWNRIGSNSSSSRNRGDNCRCSGDRSQ